jgi:hypothetical protein
MQQVEPVSRAWAFLPVLTATMVCWMILPWAMGRGYDLTDDAHYLIWVSNPFIYDWSVSEFGFLLHPIYRLVEGDIKLFRLAGATVLGGSAAIFGYALYRFAAPLLPKYSGTPLVLAITTASLWEFARWIPTPGYNELNLCGLLLFAAGLVFSVAATSPASSGRATKIATIAKAALAAFGWGIVVFAKPPSAILAFAVGLVWLAFLRPQRPILFVLSAALFSCAFCLAGIFAIDGEIQRFIERKSLGLHMMGFHSQTHGVSAIWHTAIDPLIKVAPLRIAIILAVVTLWLSALLRLEERRAQLAASLTIAVSCALTVAVGFWSAKGSLAGSYYTSLIVPALLLIGLALALALNVRRQELRGRPEQSWRPIVVAGLLALLPTCYAIGSDNPLIYQASHASVFLLAAFIVLSAAAPEHRRARIFGATVATSSFVTVAMLVGALASPYRLLTAIWNQTERVEIGPRSSPLLVDKITADYLSGLRRAASANGFHPGTPVIDLTGVSPGAIFAMGGEAPGIPWLSGGYTRSAAYVQATLERLPREYFRQAWILTGPGTSGSLPDSIPRALGLNFPQDYEMTGRFCQGEPCVEQFLWKPKTESLTKDSR